MCLRPARMKGLRPWHKAPVALRAQDNKFEEAQTLTAAAEGEARRASAQAAAAAQATAEADAAAAAAAAKRDEQRLLEEQAASVAEKVSLATCTLAPSHLSRPHIPGVVLGERQVYCIGRLL